MLDNINTKCEIKYLDFNRNSLKDIVKSTLESIVFSFVYGA